MRIGVPTETGERERRVALVPDVVKRLVSKGHTVLVQSGAGAGASIPDEAFKDAGAEISVKVAAAADDAQRLGGGSILIGFLNPLGAPDTVRALAGAGATAFAME